MTIDALIAGIAPQELRWDVKISAKLVRIEDYSDRVFAIMSEERSYN